MKYLGSLRKAFGTGRPRSWQVAYKGQAGEWGAGARAERGGGGTRWVLSPVGVGTGSRGGAFKGWAVPLRGPRGAEAANRSPPPRVPRVAGRLGKALEGGAMLGGRAPLSGGAEAVAEARAVSIWIFSPLLLLLLPNPSSS